MFENQIEMVGQPKEMEVSTEDVMRIMKLKALGFDVLFYLLCYDYKGGKIKLPKNVSKYKREDYNKVINMFKDVTLQLQDGKTSALFKKNMENYIDFLVKKLNGENISDR
jgi:hypothetical protein